MSMQDLIQTMEMLREAHGSLLELAKEKTKVLVDNKVEQLNLIIQKENKLIKHIAVLDQQRIEVIGGYLIARGYNPNPRITISDLIRIIFKLEERQMLSEAQQRLLTVLEELRDLNDLNEKLIQQSLFYIDYSLDLFAGSPDDDAFYHHPKHTGQLSNQTGYFDRRA
ncbi:flagellar protein FlgN [Paenibacillus eucommiae]|uniref:Flagellar biosynthesis/type III secretory pathway chaperone n=1 Tax=Paenibacillus eucommiae TaxID=1355755 RepID=A0ABS4J1H4_9BACL|nr:flagellar protein FlgN [Paenibacillus eucommiae]MBP1992639.1 flagellar biosynthesis/type III secretory pathway chaperone [Paenibacillus eucommiae]